MGIEAREDATLRDLGVWCSSPVHGLADALVRGRMRGVRCPSLQSPCTFACSNPPFASFFHGSFIGNPTFPLLWSTALPYLKTAMECVGGWLRLKVRDFGCWQQNRGLVIEHVPCDNGCKFFVVEHVNAFNSVSDSWSEELQSKRFC